MKADLSTIKTVIGYYLTLLEKLLGINFRTNKLQSIFNYLPISSQLSTSGQPTAEQLRTIAKNGFKLIINLAPHGAENALNNEADIVTSLGMQYIHIPVDFDNPQQQDFEQFTSAMATCGDNKTWVHCAANMRVSCFIYFYRTSILKDDKEQAEIDLNKIWQPFGVWKDFISKK